MIQKTSTSLIFSILYLGIEKHFELWFVIVRASRKECMFMDCSSTVQDGIGETCVCVRQL